MISTDLDQKRDSTSKVKHEMGDAPNAVSLGSSRTTTREEEISRDISFHPKTTVVSEQYIIGPILVAPTTNKWQVRVEGRTRQKK